MEYLVDTNIVVYRADMYSENPAKTITKNDNGFVAAISYPELEISFEVHVTLTDKGITVDVPQDSIEENSDKYKMAGLYVYPFLGYSVLGEREGYMFIPDGSGALIHLKDNNGKFKQPYSEMVYGGNAGIDDSYVLSLFNRMDPFNDPENILAPVFGMVQTDSEIGYLGIIEEGKFSSKIEAYPSGAILPYNWITSKFIYRQVYNQPTSQDTGTMVVRQKNRNDFDIKVHYQFVTGEQANYMGLADKYRDYLLGNQLIADLDTPFKARIDFLGSEVEQGLIRKKDVPMTTFSQADGILTDLQENGVSNILSIYKGWQEGGMYGGLPIRSFDPESGLDTGLSLKELIDNASDKDIDLYLYQDALRINTEEWKNTRYDLMKKFNKRTYSEDVYGNVYQSFNYLNPASSVDLLERMAEAYQSEAIDQIAVSGISNQLFSYSEGSNEFDRIATKEQYEKIISDYHNQFDLLLEQPFSYLWNKTNAIIDLPTNSSNYVFTDEDIPFISLTLKGLVPMYAEYTNFQANQDEFFLQLVEQGINPSFYITNENPSALKNTNSSDIYSSQYERYEEMIPSYYKELAALHEEIGEAMITAHEREGEMVKITYDNGVIVYVNYSDAAQTMDDTPLEAMSYKVVQGQLN
ncbi:hypothetical protein F9U64_16710 [Gracilibacillus oryzae]|uniref:Uncharacterized protein n=1 Tax=Gracilibacillus oryzae TaxID=1672701 RepID=A0A7C8KWT3_9BACI|nr:DUF5696 domain-containing protein [Gracilibacillus oryzae]KAB8128061.1 hypothetical protein F9U64_16710 [Gracilibacillus oryzae]